MKNEGARSRLGTIVTAMITPFDKRGQLDIAEAKRLAQFLVDRETDGLVLAGSTGEGQTLDKGERAALWAAVKAAVGDRAKIEQGIRSLNLGEVHLIDADGNPVH